MGSCCSSEEPEYPVTVVPPPCSQYPSQPPVPNPRPHVPDDVAYKWLRRSAGEPVPHTAVVGGRDQDGSQIYVGRAYHEGDMLPAKVIPEKDVAYVAHGGQEHAKHTFEVLTLGEFTWEFSSNGHVPPDAVIGGQTQNGEPLYVGRVIHQGSQTIGKIQQSHHCLYIPFGGEELSFRDYEVLVLH